MFRRARLRFWLLVMDALAWAGLDDGRLYRSALIRAGALVDYGPLPPIDRNDPDAPF